MRRAAYYDLHHALITGAAYRGNTYVDQETLSKRFVPVRYRCLFRAGFAQADNEIRLYVLDGGELESSPVSYNLTDAEVATTSLALSGDLYHYPEERTLDRLPTRDFDVAQTRAARVAAKAGGRLCRRWSCGPFPAYKAY